MSPLNDLNFFFPFPDLVFEIQMSDTNAHAPHKSKKAITKTTPPPSLPSGRMLVMWTSGAVSGSPLCKMQEMEKRKSLEGWE